MRDHGGSPSLLDQSPSPADCRDLVPPEAWSGAGTPLQIVNDGGTELALYVSGTPSDEGAAVLPDAT